VSDLHARASGPMNLGRWTAEGDCPYIAFLSARPLFASTFLPHGLRPFGFGQGGLHSCATSRLEADGDFASVPQRLKPGNSEVLVSRRPEGLLHPCRFTRR
jgi:hypothetical protein